MFRFITNRPFWVNLLVVIFLTAVIIWGILQTLGFITRHGEFLSVPSVTGKNTAEAITFLEARGFEVSITDSVYVDTAKMGTVLKQFPEANSTVKVNRTVLLTVNRVTLPMIDMPSLQGKSLSFALELLKRSHLQLGDTSFVPDFMMGSVLNQRYSGADIASGTKVRWGSKIDLVIGGGLANMSIPVPNLIGMQYMEAKMILEQNGIGIGALIPKPGLTDTLGAFIIKQNPPRFSDGEEKQLLYIQSGQVMDLWISPVNEAAIADSTLNSK